ncbi:unnamed protein product [Blepharisma stoltei]|uniref:PPM-type phosphatase domain-containing protein n=1 Tax=Blepharisma stoltei TaxID=1481888 RepID=A0AAU9JXK3_9CILI|nr:unnamed protein product [Blepharisma stoltei]
MESDSARSKRMASLARLRSSNEESSQVARSVVSFGYSEDQNRNYRDSMEDRHKIIDNFLENPYQGYFAIFDGHGGFEASEFCKNFFHDEFRKNLSIKNTIREVFHDTFKNIDEIFRARNFLALGTTATICYIRKEGAERVLYTANVGDSHAVLVNSRGVERLTTEDRPSNPREVERIKKSGGIISSGRVGGQLSITRALGDTMLKTSGLISEPHLSRRVIVPNDLYLIIASDGLWDSVNESELRNISGRNCLEIANGLVQKALQAGSVDNTSVIVVKLN